MKNNINHLSTNPSNILIEETTKTPLLSFDYLSNTWMIAGRSYPQDASLFYSPMLDWIKHREEEEIKECNIQFKLEYFNTNSSKVIMDILVKLRKLMEKGKMKLNITWYFEHEDEDMKDTGELMMNLAQMKFEFIGY